LISPGAETYPIVAIARLRWQRRGLRRRRSP